MKKMFSSAKKTARAGNKKPNRFSIKTMFRLDGAINKSDNNRAFNKAWTTGVLNFEG